MCKWAQIAVAALVFAGCPGSPAGPNGDKITVDHGATYNGAGSPGDLVEIDISLVSGATEGGYTIDVLGGNRLPFSQKSGQLLPISDVGLVFDTDTADRLVILPNIVVMMALNDGSFVAGVPSLVGSYDPNDGAFDPSDPGTSGDIAANGSLSLDSSSHVHGDAHLSGTEQSDYEAHIDGDLVENGSQTPIEDIDAIVLDKYDSSRAANDNATLAAVFGGSWTPQGGAENYGDLIVEDGGTYVVPAGTYRVRRMELLSNSTIIFDTSAGPVNLIYVGEGPGTGRGNDLTLESGSSVLVDSGGTSNPLLTVLGENSDFMLKSGSIWGQNPGDTATAGYSQLISLGGSASSDDIIVDSGSTFYGRIYAAAHEVSLTSGSTLYGSVLARTVVVDGSTIAIDESTLGDGLGDSSGLSVLAKWRDD